MTSLVPARVALTVTSLTCALVGGLIVVSSADFLPWTNGSLRNDPIGTLLAALACAVVSGAIAFAARRSVAHLFALWALASVLTLGGIVLFAFLRDMGQTGNTLHLPRTEEDLTVFAVVMVLLVLGAVWLFFYGTVLGLLVALAHVVPVALAARYRARQLPDAAPRTILVSAGWLAFVSGGAMRLASDKDLWRIGEVTGAVGAVFALAFGILGLVWLARSRSAPPDHLPFNSSFAVRS